MTEKFSLSSNPAITPARLAERPGGASSSLPATPEGPLPGARTALILLLLINLFNYIDRQVLAANVTPIERQLLPYREPDSVRLSSTLGLIVSPSAYAPLTAAAAL